MPEAPRRQRLRNPFRRRPLVCVIELSGVIGDIGPGRRGLALSRLETAIEAAFRPRRLAAVAIAINSPGGSPVQSRLIHDRIRREAARAGKPVFAFIEDIGASGGYILALAADEIYADPSSIVGSIGVISAGFGFHEAIARLGVERRVHAAGENKSQLDPFRHENPDDVARLETILAELHAEFIALVKARRGDRLKPAPDTFSGAFWTARGAAERGLVDGTAHLGEFMQKRFGDDVKVRRVTHRPGSLLRRLADGVGPAAGPDVGPHAWLSALEERAMWSRFGL